VLYQMSKNLNKRFFAEFLSLLSIKVNPDPELDSDPEIDITKKMLNGGSAITESTYLDDDHNSGDEENEDGEDKEDEGGGEEEEELDMDVGHKASAARHKMKKDQKKMLSKKQKAMVTHAGMKAMKKKK